MNEVTMTDDSRYRLSLRGMQERLEADIQRARDVIPHAGEKGRSLKTLFVRPFEPYYQERSGCRTDL